MALQRLVDHCFSKSIASSQKKQFTYGGKFLLQSHYIAKIEELQNDFKFESLRSS